MATKENMIESLIEIINTHFDMEISLDENNFPVVQQALVKGEPEDFINELLRVIEKERIDGKLNYYFGNVLDFDTPEEFHRH